MARRFTKVAGNYLTFGLNVYNPRLSGASVICVAARVALRAALDPTADNTVILGVINSFSTGLLLAVHNTSGGVLKAQARSQVGDSLQSVFGSSPLAPDVWYAIGARFDIGGDNIRVYLNGVSDGLAVVAFGASAYTPGTPAEQDYVGSSTQNGTTNKFPGDIAEVGIWPGDITAAGFKAHAAGLTPLQIRPDLRPMYFPLWGNAFVRDLFSTLSGTIGGSLPPQTHPPTYSSRGRSLVPTLDVGAAVPSSYLYEPDLMLPAKGKYGS